MSASTGARLAWGRMNVKGIWLRIALLFALLCLVKLAILVEFRKSLFESHWRVDTRIFTWFNLFAFYCFAALTGWQLWSLASRCCGSGVRKVRAANACVLALGAVFIFMSFHEGPKNYLAPVMNGTLTFASLRWYLACDFFFRSPYLSLWIFGYALLYYGFARSGREHLMLRVTAICATVYICLCLTDLAQYKNALAVVDCIGVACLICGSGRPGKLSLFWPALILCGVTFAYYVFYAMVADASLAQENPKFLVITGSGLILVVGVTAFSKARGFYNPWSWLLPFALATILLLTNTNYANAANYRNLLCEGFMLPRYFLGEFLLASALLVMAVGYRRVRREGSLWWLDLASVVLVALSLADLRLSQIMGARLDWSALQLAFGETPKMIWRMARPYLPGMFGVLLAVVAIYLAVLFFARKVASMRPVDMGGTSLSRFAFFLVAFSFLGIAGTTLLERDKAVGETVIALARTSPVWQRATTPLMSKQMFIQSASSLGMNQITAPQQLIPSHPRRDLNVVLIFQESTYDKYLSLFGGRQDTEPLLSQYKDRMQLFPNFYSNFAGSINARFATFTGLYPVQDYTKFTVQRVNVKSIFELLHDQGYDTSLFYSSYFDYTDFGDFLRGRKLDAMYDAESMPGERKTKPVAWGLREDEALAAMQRQIVQYAGNHQKFFLTYIPAAPHNPFDGTPARFQKHKLEKVKDYTPLYLNELLYMDWVVSSIVDQLRDSGLLDNTLVVITSDHGEMLGENGGPIGHGWAVNPPLANIPLIIMDPANRGYQVNDTPGSQVDLLPTVLDLLGINPGGGQLYQGNSLYSVRPDQLRTIYLSSLNQYGILRGYEMVCSGRDKSGGEGSGKVFKMTNIGASTSVEEQTPGSDRPVTIADFDRFQENFLRNYQRYCEMLQPSSTHP